MNLRLERLGNVLVGAGVFASDQGVLTLTERGELCLAEQEPEHGAASPLTWLLDGCGPSSRTRWRGMLRGAMGDSTSGSRRRV